jgi:2-keto-3-deoxy-L-rhamnonate aldolase RhmA
MSRSGSFVEKLKKGEVALGTVISLLDPAVTELLAEDLDFVWIDMEHSPQTLATLQGHLMATKGSTATPLVRVPWNDPVLIKPVLDGGAAGVIVPMVRTADEARQAVAACLYPPKGDRGFGPRRPSRYGRLGGPSFCQQTNDEMICILQIEHIDAIHSIESIIAVPGVTSLVVGPNDLSGSMGHMGEPSHPEVVKAIDVLLEKAGRAGMPVGIGIGADPRWAREWIDKGMKWIAAGSDTALLLGALKQLLKTIQHNAPNA